MPVSLNKAQKDILIGGGALAVIVLSALLLLEMPGEVGGPAIAEVPAMTPMMEQVLGASTGFQLLVSYTNEGFEPTRASIREGDTVRFTNNSDTTLWVAASLVNGGERYPRGEGACGESSFDSCTLLAPHEFWEFTFLESGTWGYHNAGDTSHTAALEVL